ncbi:uncharacterized protein [Macrobrachium rosenbergii]|uniref:uncharacterized protein n=1 Tax=Macrobrachium rosenbergii TaxID=79674 RepID=UPI0034D76C3B
MTVVEEQVLGKGEEEKGGEEGEEEEEEGGRGGGGGGGGGGEFHSLRSDRCGGRESVGGGGGGVGEEVSVGGVCSQSVVLEDPRDTYKYRCCWREGRGRVCRCSSGSSGSRAGVVVAAVVVQEGVTQYSAITIH